MAILQAIILGIVEGLTEFLPISSTGHLIVAENVISYKDAAEIFAVVVQLGALAAVLWFYRKDLISKFAGLFSGDKKALNFWKIWIIATIPAGLAGLLIESKLSSFATLPVIGTTLLVGGILIWLIETYHKPKKSFAKAQLDNISTKQAWQVGFYQILALVPGVSRSGSTIMGGLMSGLDRVTATAFSFYMSIPILLLAGLFKLAKDRDQIAYVSGGGMALIAGTIAAFVTALMVIGWLLKYVSNHNFKPFAYYRIGLGILILITVIM